MRTSYRLFAGTLATGLVVAGLAYGQQQNSDEQTQQLSNRDARQFMQQLQNGINQMMQSGNTSRLRQWIQNNIANDAVLSGTRRITTNGQSTGFAAATLTKQDLLRLQRFAIGSLDMQNPSRDFNMSIRVTNVQPIGDTAALVKSQIMESMSLGNEQSGVQGSSGSGNRQSSRNQAFTEGSASENQQYSRNQAFSEGAGNEQGSQGQQRFAQRQGQQGGMQIESDATCTHLLQRNENSGNIQIVMGVCNAETQPQ